MRGDENVPEDWFKLAKRDLETAELLVAHDKIDAAAAPAQQAAEKLAPEYFPGDNTRDPAHVKDL